MAVDGMDAVAQSLVKGTLPPRHVWERVLVAVGMNGGCASTGELVALTGNGYTTIVQAVGKLHREGLLRRSRGRYCLTDLGLAELRRMATRMFEAAIRLDAIVKKLFTEERVPG